MAIPSQRPHRWTYADIVDWPEAEDGKRYEIIDGELVVSTTPDTFHQLVAMEAMARLGEAVRPERLGRIFPGRIDVLLRDGGVLVPDLIFIRQDRLGIVGPTAIEGPPDIVVEILSPATRDRDLGRKKELYAELGVPEDWVVDPIARDIDVFVLRDGRYEPLPKAGGVIRSGVLPDLAIDIAALFADADL